MNDEVNPTPGELVYNWLRRAIATADRTGSTVRGKFNDISMTFSPGDTLPQACDIYDLKTKLVRYEKKGI